MKLTPKQIYDKLKLEDKILDLKGQITFSLADVDIVIKQKDVVGNIMQEWLQGWLDKNDVDYLPSDNTQMPPDFYLDPDDKTKNLLEVKAFNRDAGPGFDIADFNAYQKEIIESPYMLHADYLIFGYVMDNNGFVTIKDLWLKKVWEITRRMAEWPINLQVKDKVVHKIRPATWYSERASFDTFESLEEFVSAIEETVYQNPKTHGSAANWRSRFTKSYYDYSMVDIDIPRWDDIKDKFKN